MTPNLFQLDDNGYVAPESYRMERDDLARAVGVEPGFGQRLRHRRARFRRFVFSEVEEALLAVIRARSRHKTLPASDDRKPA